MKFVCEKCRAQYVISDEKVNPAGVKVRCKKCDHVNVVRRIVVTADDSSSDPTILVQLPVGEAQVPGPPPSATPFDGPGFDEELGQAFDSVLGLDEGAAEQSDPAPTIPTLTVAKPEGEQPRAAEPVAPEPASNLDTDSTRVIDLGALNELAKASAPAPAADGNGGGARAVAGPEWFVAVNDQQVGPLSVADVKEKFDRGELTPDSLAWKQGFGDWKPLSSIEELAHLLAPLSKPGPARPAVELPWTAGSPPGSAATAPAPIAAAAGQEAAEPEWRPSAASALASLAREEMEALAKPAKKARPEAPASGGGGGPGRGLLDIPDAPVSDLHAVPGDSGPQAIPDLAYKPGDTAPAALVRRAVAAHDARSAEAPIVRPLTRSRSSEPKVNPLYLVIGGGFLFLGAVAVIIALIFSGSSHTDRAEQEHLARVEPPVAPPPAVVTQAPGTAQAAAVPALPPVVAAPVAPVAAPPAPAALPTPSAAAPAPMAQVPPAATSSKITPSSPPKHSPRPPHEEPQASPRAPPKKGRGAAAEEAPAAEAAAPSQAKNKVDDDFDKLFGGGGSPTAAVAEARPSKKKKEVYIPPAPGQSDEVPDVLSPSDVMAVVKENKPALARCAKEQAARDPDLHGKLVMQWAITKDGRTGQIQNLTTEFNGSAMASCLKQAITSWRFPPHKGAMDPIQFPFTF